MPKTRAETSRAPRRQRADAQRNVRAILEAASVVFDNSGVDAPVKEIADRAAVGVGTLYRHFPRRADLIKAVIESRIDALAESGIELAATLDPDAALREWLHRYTELLATKRGLANALHSGDPAFDGLPDYFFARVGPTLAALLEKAVAQGSIRPDVAAEDILWAVAHLSLPVSEERAGHAQRMVTVFVDGLRHGTRA